jgi:hypothetical protein
MRTRSPPSSAAPRLLGLDISPSTISTVGTFMRSAAFALSLTRIRTGTRCRTNSFAMKEPAVPVAPVRSIISVSPLVSLFTEGAPGGAHRLAPVFVSALTKTFGIAKKESPWPAWRCVRPGRARTDGAFRKTASAPVKAVSGAARTRMQLVAVEGPFVGRTEAIECAGILLRGLVACDEPSGKRRNPAPAAHPSQSSFELVPRTSRFTANSVDPSR